MLTEPRPLKKRLGIVALYYATQAYLDDGSDISVL